MYKTYRKYGNQPVTVDGIRFDSIREATRWQELKLLLRAGKISDLKRQVPFELIPNHTEDGKVTERKVVYKADFVYNENGDLVVEDAKGRRTKEYIIKRKMMLWRYGIKIREV